MAPVAMLSSSILFWFLLPFLFMIAPLSTGSVVPYNETHSPALAEAPLNRFRLQFPRVIQEFHRIGGSGGSYFQKDQIREEAVVEKIEVWSYRNSLAAVHLTFSNGHVEKIGDRGSHKYQGSFTIDYASGERVTELSIWGNGAGTRCGAFRIKTSKNTVFHPKMWKWGLKTEYKMNVGGGIILGAWGKSTGVVNSLGILMLRKVSAANLEIPSTGYQQSPSQLSPPRLVSVLAPGHQNPSGTDNPRGLIKFTREKVNSHEWTVTAGLKIGKEFTVTAGVPNVAQAGLTASWELSLSSSYARTWTESQSTEVSIPYTVPAYSQVDVSVSYFEGVVSHLPFEGKMQHLLEGGESFYTSVRGYYKGVSTTHYEQTTKITHRYDPINHRWIETDGSPSMIRTRSVVV